MLSALFTAAVRLLMWLDFQSFLTTPGTPRALFSFTLRRFLPSGSAEKPLSTSLSTAMLLSYLLSAGLAGLHLASAQDAAAAKVRLSLKYLLD